MGNRKSLTHCGVRQPRLPNLAEEEQDRSPAGGAGPLLAPGAKGVSKREGWAQSPMKGFRLVLTQVLLLLNGVD